MIDMKLSKPNIKELKKNLDVEGLIGALGYGDWRVRRDAASALSKIAEEKAITPTALLENMVEPLMKALKDENVEVRRAAALGLMWTFFGAAWDIDEREWAFDEARTKEVVELLIEAFVKDEDESVRNTAVLAIGSIPVPIRLEEGERVVRRVKDVDGVMASGFFLLTNKRLIYHGCRTSESFSIEIPLTEIISCEVKKPLIGKRKLLVTGRQAVFKSLSNLVIKEVAMHGYSQPPASVMKPKPLEFTFKEMEGFKSEIMQQRSNAYKPLQVKCPSCGASTPVGTVFCPSCGRKVGV